MTFFPCFRECKSCVSTLKSDRCDDNEIDMVQTVPRERKNRNRPFELHGFMNRLSSRSWSRSGSSERHSLSARTLEPRNPFVKLSCEERTRLCAVKGAKRLRNRKVDMFGFLCVFPDRPFLGMQPLYIQSESNDHQHLRFPQSRS